MTNEDTFKESAIDEINHNEYLHKFLAIHSHCPIEKVIDMVKSIPNSVLRLENFYDLQDKFKVVPNCKPISSCLKYETINLGRDSNPQSINLAADCTPLKKSTFIKLFKEYRHICIDIWWP